MSTRKMKTVDYVECPRCKTNNFDDPTFWGCPRGSCEVEVKGTILYTTILTLDETIDEN